MVSLLQFCPVWGDLLIINSNEFGWTLSCSSAGTKMENILPTLKLLEPNSVDAKAPFAVAPCWPPSVEFGNHQMRCNVNITCISGRIFVQKLWSNALILRACEHLVCRRFLWEPNFSNTILPYMKTYFQTMDATKLSKENSHCISALLLWTCQIKQLNVQVKHIRKRSFIPVLQEMCCFRSLALWTAFSWDASVHINKTRF